MISIRHYLLFVFIFSIFVDMFNGYCRMFLHIEPMFPLIYKGAIILYSLPFVFKQPKILLCFLIFALLLSFDMVSWVAHGHLEGLKVLFDELIRLVYPFLCFLLSFIIEMTSIGIHFCIMQCIMDCFFRLLFVSLPYWV